MSDWKIINHAIITDENGEIRGYHLEVGIEAAEGGWEQVRVKDFPADHDRDPVEYAVWQKKCFREEIEAEWHAAMGDEPVAEQLSEPGTDL